MSNSKLVAAAGEHHVASVLALLGFIPAMVREGSPAVDLLASNARGSRAVGIQVKTTGWAGRERGRGTSRKPSYLDFPLGHAAIEYAKQPILFAFVDLRGEDPRVAPDVYLMTGEQLLAGFSGFDPSSTTYLRLQWSLEAMAPFKNNWQPIRDALV